jgi:iron-sulfur cluster repair protein YtfE (RIC family)
MTLCPQLRRLAGDHARWLAEIARRSNDEEERRCARLLALWEEEILPHCRAEEEVLLPELAARLSEADAVIVFTQSDHVALRRLARELRGARGAARTAALGQLEQKLVEHARFEEKTLFPALQESLGCDRVAALETELGVAGNERRHRPTDAPPVAHQARKGSRS